MHHSRVELSKGVSRQDSITYIETVSPRRVEKTGKADLLQALSDQDLPKAGF